jgi:cysteine synthase A
MNIAQDVSELIGSTPMLQCERIERSLKLKAHLWAKVESCNPLRSVKDRVALALIEAAEEKELIGKHTVIIEPTSGNTGVGLAMVAAIKGYRLILTMPDSMSLERRTLLKALGAEIVLTPSYEGMGGAILKAEELAEHLGDAFIPQQFYNPANAEVHRRTTGPEIWRDLHGEVDAFVAGIGTGGTITGVGEYLKRRNPQVRVFGVEPAGSPVLSGGRPGPHRLQGIGAGFVPKVLNTKVYTEIIRIRDDEAYAGSRALARWEGLLAGITSGAALHAAITVAQRPEMAGRNIVFLLPDTGERYLSLSLFDTEE